MAHFWHQHLMFIINYLHLITMVAELRVSKWVRLSESKGVTLFYFSVSINKFTFASRYYSLLNCWQTCCEVSKIPEKSPITPETWVLSILSHKKKSPKDLELAIEKSQQVGKHCLTVVLAACPGLLAVTKYCRKACFATQRYNCGASY